MSNPGVIVLSKKKLDKKKSFIVEDNIGEAIHLHYDDIRIDMTVKNYIELCDNVKESIQQLIEIENFSVDYFDPVFLDMISGYLLDLESIQFKKIALEDLQIQTVLFGGIPVIRRLNKSRVFKALHGNTAEEENYVQENLRNESNLDRVKKIYESVKENGYPYNNQYIVLFNNQNYIRDGQHRAASMLFEEGNKEVEVMVLNFKNNKYSLSAHPWIRYIFVINREKLRNIKRVGYRVLRKIYHLIKK